METIITTLVIFLVVVTLLQVFGGKKEILSNWSHYFDFFQFSTTDFYSEIREQISKRNLPSVSIETIEREESNTSFLSKRLYLRISSSGYVFDVCAAPYGNGYFVSWWLLEDTDFLTLLFTSIPLVGKFLSKKTFYQLDTETMFRTCIHAAIQDAIKVVTEDKGYRSLTNTEKQLTILSARKSL